MYRRTPSGNVEAFLVHPGGPFWKNRDEGAWTIPKGLIDEGEEPLTAACREFQEETGLPSTGPYVALGTIRQKAGKVVHVWAFAGDADPAAIVSNTTRIELPRGSGRWLTVPEIDRAGWFDLETARRKLNVAQAVLIDRLAGRIQ